jgi:hypothetical protein
LSGQHLCGHHPCHVTPKGHLARNTAGNGGGGYVFISTIRDRRHQKVGLLKIAQNCPLEKIAVEERKFHERHK